MAMAKVGRILIKLLLHCRVLSLTPDVIVDEAEEAVFRCVVDANPIR